MIREAIAELVTGKHLSADEAEAVMNEIMTREATPAQIGSFLTALRIKGETSDEIAGCVRAMRANAILVRPRAALLVDTADIAAILPEDLTGKGKALFIDAIQHSLPSFSKDGIVTVAGLKNAIEINKALGAIKPDQQINASALCITDFVKYAR